MFSFEYNGQSTETIVDKPLRIVQFDSMNDIDGFHREIIKGEKTLLRQEVNHYGAMYSDDSTYEFYLVKVDGSPFTEIEQRKINKWLTSPQLVKPLNCVTDDGENVIYRGVFQNVGWKMITGRMDGVKCSLVCDTPFSWKKETHSYSCTDSLDIELNIDSDDSECFIYPKITVTTPNTMQTIQLINNSDSGNKMEILCYPNLQISIDCKYCIITDGTISGIVDYKDLGWKDAGNIYWTRLKDGVNLLTIKGECNLIITYDIPLKRAGDFV